MLSVDAICSILRTLVSERRYEHILRVADTGKKLAEIHGENPENAYLAGLIHDTAKQLTPALAAEKNIQLSQEEVDLYAAFSKVWHALVAPTVCKFLFEITDEDVLLAAKWHTTGTRSMKPLEQIVFIADYIEPGRVISDRAYIQELAYRSLDKATFALSSSTLVSLCERGLNIHPESIACYNYYHSKLSRAEAEEIAATVFQIKFTK